MYDYEGLILLLRKMIMLAHEDTEQATGEDGRSAYLFLYWVQIELVPYLEGTKG